MQASFHVNGFVWEADTHRPIHIASYQLPGQKQFQETRCVPGLLAMYSWLKAFYCERNGKYSITFLL